MCRVCAYVKQNMLVLIISFVCAVILLGSCKVKTVSLFRSWPTVQILIRVLENLLCRKLINFGMIFYHHAYSLDGGNYSGNGSDRI